MSLSEEDRSRLLSGIRLVLGCVLLVGAVVLFLWKATPVALLIFGGILLGILLHGLAEELRSRTGLSYGLSLLGVGTAIVVVGGALAWLLGPRAVEQFGRLAERLPEAVRDVESWLRQFALGRAFLAFLPAAEDADSRAVALLGRATEIFKATFGALSSVFVIGFLGIYFAADPSTYRRALVWLAPPAWRERTDEVIEALASALRSWLLGRIASMLAVTLLTAVGLVALGVPLVISLALLAGLLNFVPLIGPIAAAVPAVLLAWGASGGLGLALWVALFYWGVQLVEGFGITPYIQKRVVSIPPALLVSSQIIMGIAAGVIGVVFATPIAVVVVVLIQMLYEEDMLHEDVHVWGS